MQQKASSFSRLCPRPPDEGLCPWTSLGAQPQDPQHLPQFFLFPSKHRVSALIKPWGQTDERTPNRNITLCFPLDAAN